MVVTKLLRHQGSFIQAPYVYDSLRFYFLIAGYASGKSTCLNYALLYAVTHLSGLKDNEGKMPKILVGGISLTFMRKTITGALEQILKNTKTEYYYDKAHNIIEVAGCQLLLVPINDESNIFGYDVCVEKNTLISTEYGDRPISELKVGERVWTTQGLKRIKHVWNNGIKDCVRVKVDGKEIICTPDHKFIDAFNRSVEANDLTKMDTLVKLNTKEASLWQAELGKNKSRQMLLNSMASDITDTLTARVMENHTITLALTKIKREVTQLTTEICGDKHMVKSQKAMTYTTKMRILLTTLSTILSAYLALNTAHYTTVNGQKKENKNNLKQLRKLQQLIRKSSRILSTKQKLLQDLTLNDITRNVLYVVQSLLQKLVSLNIAVQNVEEKELTKITEKSLSNIEKQELAKSVASNSSVTSMHLLQPVHLDAEISNVVGQYEVYDIEVEDAHEFFAEGIRVHNCCAFIDELDELPTYESMGIVKSVNDRCRQRVKGFRAPFIAVTTTSQGLKGTYQTVMEFKKAGIPYMIVRGRTKDNIYLPKEYVDSMYKIYNEKETQCLLEGKFISIDSGLVFPDYNPEVNKLDVDLYDYVRINGLPVYIGQDFNGFGNYAQAYSLFTFSDGKVAIVMIKDYKLPDMRRAPETFRYDFPHSEIVWIPDMTYQNNFSQFKHELKVNNIKIAYRKSNPLVNDRNFACNKLMHVECFYLCPMCKMSDTALMTHQKDPKTGLPMKGGDGAPDHLNDCMGYVVHYLLSWKKELKCLYDVTLGYKYKKRHEQGEEDEKNLEIGGYVMEADKLRDSPVRGLEEKRTKQKNVDMAIIE